MPWSDYVHLLSVKDAQAQEHYKRGALAGGWSVCVWQLDRQTASLARERTRDLIQCSEKDATVAHYALGNLGNQALARWALPCRRAVRKKCFGVPTRYSLGEPVNERLAYATISILA